MLRRTLGRFTAQAALTSSALGSSQQPSSALHQLLMEEQMHHHHQQHEQSGALLHCNHRAVKMFGSPKDSVVCLKTGCHAAITGTAELAQDYINHVIEDGARSGSCTEEEGGHHHASPLRTSTSSSSFGTVTLKADSRDMTRRAQANISVCGPSTMITALRNGKIMFNCHSNNIIRQSSTTDPLHEEYTFDVVDGDILVILSNVCLQQKDAYVDTLLNAVASNIMSPPSGNETPSRIDVESVAEEVLVRLPGGVGEQSSSPSRTVYVAQLGSANLSNLPQPPTTIFQ